MNEADGVRTGVGKEGGKVDSGVIGGRMIASFTKLSSSSGKGQAVDPLDRLGRRRRSRRTILVLPRVQWQITLSAANESKDTLDVVSDEETAL